MWTSHLRITALGLVLAACTPGIQRNDWVRRPSYYSVNRDGSRSAKYSRINQLVQYGPRGLGAQAQIAAAYEDAQHAPPPGRDVEIFNAEMPPGITIDNQMIHVDDRARYDVIARYEIGYWLEAAPQESEIADDLQRLAAVTATDAVVVEVRHMAHGDPRVNFLSGLVLRKRQAADARGAGSERAPEQAPGQALERAPVRVRRTARLDYIADGPGCLTTDELADEISARLGYVPWDPRATTALRVEIARREGSFEATLWLGDGAAPRRLTAASCRSVAEALISVVVTHLDLTGPPPARYD
jgi:hypothetical protein